MKYSKYNLIIHDDETNKIILFNTLQGAYIEIDENIAKMVENKDVDGIDSEARTLFINKGIVVRDDVDETRVFSYFHDKSKYVNDTINSTVLLTWACNLKCVYCFEGEKTCAFVMNKEYADRYIRFISNLMNLKKPSNLIINLFGGEPMTNIEVGYYILEELRKICDERNVAFSSTIITNGTLIDEEKLNRLLELNCRSFQITIDGMKETHDKRRIGKHGEGTFDTIIETLSLMNRKVAETKAFSTIIRVNIDKNNIDETFKLLKYLGKDGLNLTNCSVDFGIVHGFTESCAAYSSNCFAEEELGDILSELWDAAEKEGFIYDIRPSRRWLYCGLYGDNQYTVTPECDVYKCWEHVGEEEHKIGKIDAEGNMSDVLFAFYDWMSHNPIENSDCRECKYLPSCGGGCGMVSYANSGSYHEAGCFKIKGVVEKQLLKLYRKQMNY